VLRPKNHSGNDLHRLIEKRRTGMKVGKSCVADHAKYPCGILGSAFRERQVSHRPPASTAKQQAASPLHAHPKLRFAVVMDEGYPATLPRFALMKTPRPWKLRNRGRPERFNCKVTRMANIGTAGTVDRRGGWAGGRDMEPPSQRVIVDSTRR